jgi:hypothetical protein
MPPDTSGASSFMATLSFHPSKRIAPEAIEKQCSGMHLTLTMKGSLKSLLLNMHWHYKKGKEKGVMEITLLQQSNEVIITYKANRSGAWIEEAMESLKSRLSAE